MTPVSPMPPIVASNSRGVARRRAMMDAAVGAQQLEGLDMAAERAAAMMVLAVHVIGDGAAERHELRARHDLREEAVRRGMRDDVGKQRAGLRFEDAGLRRRSRGCGPSARMSISAPAEFRQVSP